MIPLPQHFLAPSGVVPLPIEPDPEVSAPEADGFALLMELPAELANDLAAMTMTPPQMPWPQPATAPFAEDLKPSSVAPVEPDQPVQMPSELVEVMPEGVRQSLLGAVPAKLEFAVPFVHPSEPQDRTQPAAPGSDTLALMVDGHAEPSRGQFEAAELSPSMGKANFGENAFLTRLETKVEPFAPNLTVLSMAAKSAQAASPSATMDVIVATPPVPKVSTAQIIKQDQIFVGALQTPATLDRGALPAPTNATVAKTVMSTLEGKSLDVPAPPDPQIIVLSGADRPPAAPQIAPVPLPASIPATLLAHAPEAAVGPVEIVLDPKDLGKIRFEIHQQGDHVKVVLAVERPETLDLLRRHADQLIQEFRAAGFAGASLGFGHWGGHRGGTSSQAAVAEPDSQPTEKPIPMQQPSPSRTFGPQQGLNLRL